MASDLATVFDGDADGARQAQVAAAQERIVAARNAVSRFAQMASLKTLLAKLYGHDGWTRQRPPLMPLTAAAATAVHALFDAS